MLINNDSKNNTCNDDDKNKFTININNNNDKK